MNEFGVNFNNQQEPEVKRAWYSKDIYGIGRLEYFLTSLCINLVGGFVVAILAMIIGFALGATNFLGDTPSANPAAQLIITAIVFVLYLPIVYFQSLVVAKRFYGMGWAEDCNALSKGIAFTFGLFVLGFIPCISLIAGLVGLVVGCFLLFKPSVQE